jgi:hypothetical protein
MEHMSGNKMKTLKKQELDYSRAAVYVVDNLRETSTLSERLLKIVDFKNGNFFTLLPEDANLERLYEFEAGEILPQSPVEIQRTSHGEISTYTWIPTLEEELSDFIFKKIKNNKWFCVFDDVIHSSDSKHLKSIRFDGALYNYNKQVFYLLNSNNITHDLALTCVKKADSLWHFLCILTEANFNDVNDRQLSLEKLDEICLKAQIIAVGAYDGEGYIFWEKNKR